jgi:hypothetical protein
METREIFKVLTSISFSKYTRMHIGYNVSTEEVLEECFKDDILLSKLLPWATRIEPDKPKNVIEDKITIYLQSQRKRFSEEYIQTSDQIIEATEK